MCQEGPHTNTPTHTLPHREGQCRPTLPKEKTHTDCDHYHTHPTHQDVSPGATTTTSCVSSPTTIGGGGGTLLGLVYH